MTTETTQQWKVTLLAGRGEPTVVAGLSRDQARSAISALVTGDEAAIELLADARLTTPLKRAA